MAKVTPQDVRDAIINCFYEAHCADTGLGEDKPTGRQYCLSIVKRAFKEQVVDFDNPTKEGILKVLSSLAEFSKNFRSQEIIEKHKNQIISLLNQIV